MTQRQQGMPAFRIWPDPQGRHGAGPGYRATGYKRKS
jgi:hypothetical protein